MKLFWAPQTRAQRGIWMLEEAGVNYDMERIDLDDSQRLENDEFRTASPMGKVPALVDGDVALSDSAAICLYLADRYAMGTLAPALDDAQRGKYLYWMVYTPGVIEPAMAERFSNIEPNRRRNGWGDFDLMIETWEAGLDDSEWILGDRFSAADVMLGSSAIFLRQFGMLPDTRNLEAYADRCADRPAYRRAVEKAAG